MLHIERLFLNKLVRHAESTPEECCGFLFGHETQYGRIITMIKATQNVTARDKHCFFEISPIDYLKAENFAEENNLQLLGIYHSHPNQPAIPSVYDRLAAQPHFSYIIVSVMPDRFTTIRSWRLNNLQFEEEKIYDQTIYQSFTIDGNRIHSNTAA